MWTLSLLAIGYFILQRESRGFGSAIELRSQPKDRIGIVLGRERTFSWASSGSVLLVGTYRTRMNDFILTMSGAHTHYSMCNRNSVHSSARGKEAELFGLIK